jgi:hypothetical protein
MNLKNMKLVNDKCRKTPFSEMISQTSKILKYDYFIGGPSYKVISVISVTIWLLRNNGMFYTCICLLE